MKIKFEINTGSVVTLELTEQQINEFKLKRDSIEPEERLEMFIVQDVKELVQNEIDNGLYGMFNY